MSMLSNRLNKHFVAAAAVAVVGATQVATAAIVSSGPVSIAIPATTAGTYLNVVTGVNNVSPGLVSGWDLNPWNASNLSWFNPSSPVGGVYVTGGGSSTTLVDNLAAGTLISGASVYGSGASESTGSTAFNLNSSNNLVGFRFLNEGTATVNYGWVRVLLGAAQNTAGRAMIEYAYEDTGAGIEAGRVPTPGSLALLGLGGLAAACCCRV